MYQSMEKTEQTNLLSSKKQKNDKHDVTRCVFTFLLHVKPVLINPKCNWGRGGGSF